MYLSTEQAAQIKLDIFRSILISLPGSYGPSSAATLANEVFDEMYEDKKGVQAKPAKKKR